LTASAGQIEEGRVLYVENCGGCHGTNAVARYGGSVPDLRYTTTDVHTAWPAIVIGGARRMNGMPPFSLEPSQAEAIRNYVLSLSQAMRDARDNKDPE
jgi:quinohemoprotein ethanol dehydrogenase